MKILLPCRATLSESVSTWDGNLAECSILSRDDDLIAPSFLRPYDCLTTFLGPHALHFIQLLLKHTNNATETEVGSCWMQQHLHWWKRRKNTISENIIQLLFSYVQHTGSIVVILHNCRFIKGLMSKATEKPTPLLIPSIWKLLVAQYHSWKC